MADPHGRANQSPTARFDSVPRAGARTVRPTQAGSLCAGSGPAVEVVEAGALLAQNLDRTCLENVKSHALYTADGNRHILNSALKAGSTLYPLATSTAFTTFESIEGKASTSVVSACACGLSGRGGFAGGVSSSCSWKLTRLGCAAGSDKWSGAWLSWGSSSKSGSLAVVGDSAPVVLGFGAWWG
jgi:hypothetical protein